MGYNIILQVYIVAFVFRSIFGIAGSFPGIYLGISVEECQEFIMPSILLLLSSSVLFAGVIALQKYKKVGLHCVTASAILAFITWFVLPYMKTSIYDSIGFIIFYFLFFFLKKDGVTAYKLLFNNK